MIMMVYSQNSVPPNISAGSVRQQENLVDNQKCQAWIQATMQQNTIVVFWGDISNQNQAEI